MNKEEEKLEEKLKQVNTRLKIARIGVALFRKGKRLYLRATLPPKPGVDRDKPYQQDLSLGIYASDEGIKQAEVQAKALGSQISRDRFVWAEWLRGRNNYQRILVGGLPNLRRTTLTDGLEYLKLLRHGNVIT